jgi:hypothetical protein
MSDAGVKACLAEPLIVYLRLYCIARVVKKWAVEVPGNLSPSIKVPFVSGSKFPQLFDDWLVIFDAVTTPIRCGHPRI